LEQYIADFKLTDDWQPEMGDRQQLKQQILNRLHDEIAPAKPKIFRIKYWAAAASVLLVLSAGLWVWQHRTPANLVAAQTSPKGLRNIILPGSNKATLTLADGSVLNLDISKKGTLSRQGNVAVNKTADGQLVYDTTKSNNHALVAGYNTVATPRGGQYQLVLADGTKVWLNAATTLKFPPVFAGKERRVELSGEAYFEVAKNKEKPFKVTVNGMAVEVLGTHFNIMGYNDDKTVQTTLLEGSVKLTSSSQTAMLVPGQQGTMANQQNTSFRVQNVNTDDAVAWKNGYFTFRNEDIAGVMKKVSRWYDVDINYRGNLANRTFGGSVSRFVKHNCAYRRRTL
jgi:transmembrane sensor